MSAANGESGVLPDEKTRLIDILNHADKAGGHSAGGAVGQKSQPPRREQILLAMALFLCTLTHYLLRVNISSELFFSQKPSFAFRLALIQPPPPFRNTCSCCDPDEQRVRAVVSSTAGLYSIFIFCGIFGRTDPHGSSH